MMARCWHGLVRFRLLGKMLLSGLLICCLTDVACSQGKSGSAYDVTQRRLEQIPPGTVIGKNAPKGWTNLLIKSYSRPGAGDMKQLSPLADRLARLLFTAILADVKADTTRDGKRYKLAKVAVGLGVRIRDKDTIITPETERRLSAGLGLLARVVLRTAQEKVAEIMVVARSDTLTIFDSPSFIVREGKHRPIVLRYAILVDAGSGQLNTLVWVLDREEHERGVYGGPSSAIEWLPADLNDDCILHVDGTEFSLGQPTERAFAMTAPPKGKKEIAVSDDLKPLIAQRRFSPTVAADLENKLREAIKQAEAR